MRTTRENMVFKQCDVVDHRMLVRQSERAASGCHLTAAIRADRERERSALFHTSSLLAQQTVKHLFRNCFCGIGLGIRLKRQCAIVRVQAAPAIS
jgi:hypothetical protein